MSKLKVAKAVKTGFKFVKWIVIVGGIAGVLWLLWLWAHAHFLSFAIIMGIVTGLLLLWGTVEAWDWSSNVIEAAKEEEREAQERDRAEKIRQELDTDNPVPSKHTVPTFKEYDDYYDPTDREGHYR